MSISLLNSLRSILQARIYISCFTPISLRHSCNPPIPEGSRGLRMRPLCAAGKQPSHLADCCSPARSSSVDRGVFGIFWLRCMIFFHHRLEFFGVLAPSACGKRIGLQQGVKVLCERLPAEGHSRFKQFQLQVTYAGAPKYHLGEDIIRLHSVQQGTKSSASKAR